MRCSKCSKTSNAELVVCGECMANMVEVVFCKDCKFRRYIDGEYCCANVGGMLGQEDMDFCSYGEKE